ncbi:hypothetical protein A1O7_02105 [Cladophialophora yegresii CBS 114405]|uniref:Uncharacterized protein n=1 Tax=Cladophialophora yegresii CBS 114405 TaxID=1182544 RepID=W9WAW3_9EURO|nr:uncharacterized protein A1O7_02105 [Cladophialophora yegresii CBS 114405]EXJ61676.1 hypothetical protein A1O7_02105 [Cladophialophora yegresii CBS 114405]
MDSPGNAPEHEFLPGSDDCSPEEPLHKSRFSSPHAAGEPGPAVSTHTEGGFDSEELEYFRSLPEQALKAIYPDGIRPPANLGPHAPFDRYDKFHQALLNLAAGVSLRDVIRFYHFDIDAKQFVRHMAIFCVKSLGYTNHDLYRLDVHLSELGYADDDDATSMSQCPSGEAFGDLFEDQHDNEQGDVVELEGTTDQQSQTGDSEQSQLIPDISQIVEPAGTSSSKTDPSNERLQEHKPLSTRARVGRVALSTFFKFVLAALGYAVPIMIICFSYETLVRPHLASSTNAAGWVKV